MLCFVSCYCHCYDVLTALGVANINVLLGLCQEFTPKGEPEPSITITITTVLIVVIFLCFISCDCHCYDVVTARGVATINDVDRCGLGV